MKPIHAVIAAAVCALHACGGAYTLPEPATASGEAARDELPADDDRVLTEYDARAGDLATRLDAALPLTRPHGESLDYERSPGHAMASEQDCDAARALRDRICELADRICVIADRRPDDTDVHAKCRDARTRCEHARTSVAAGCGD